MKFLKSILLGSLLLLASLSGSVGQPGGAEDGGGKPQAQPSGSPSGRPRRSVGHPQGAGLPSTSAGVPVVAAARVDESEESTSGAEDTLLESFQDTFKFEWTDYLENHPKFAPKKKDSEEPFDPYAGQDETSVWDRLMEYDFVEFLMKHNRDELFMDAMEAMAPVRIMKKFAMMNVMLRGKQLAKLAHSKADVIIRNKLKGARTSLGRCLLPSLLEETLKGLEEYMQQSAAASIRVSEKAYNEDSEERINAIVAGLAGGAQLLARGADQDGDEDDKEDNEQNRTSSKRAADEEAESESGQPRKRPRTDEDAA